CTAGGREHGRYPSDKFRRRRVRYKATDELGRDVASGRGMIACDVDHRIQFLLARAWCDDLAEHCLAAGIMQRGIEVDGAAPPFCPKPPASKALGQFGDIALRVASVDSEGVQFEQLAGIVFVGLVAGSGLLGFLAV